MNLNLKSKLANIDKESSPSRSLVDEANLVSRVVSEGELKKAVIEIFNRLPDDESTHIMCLYVLRIMDNPAILESDVRYIQLRESLSRHKRDVGQKVKKYAYTIIGLIAIPMFLYVLKLLGLA